MQMQLIFLPASLREDLREEFIIYELLRCLRRLKNLKIVLFQECLQGPSDTEKTRLYAGFTGDCENIKRSTNPTASP